MHNYFQFSFNPRQQAAVLPKVKILVKFFSLKKSQLELRTCKKFTNFYYYDLASLCVSFNVTSAMPCHHQSNHHFTWLTCLDFKYANQIRCSFTKVYRQHIACKMYIFILEFLFSQRLSPINTDYTRLKNSITYYSCYKYASFISLFIIIIILEQLNF